MARASALDTPHEDALAMEEPLRARGVRRRHHGLHVARCCRWHAAAPHIACGRTNQRAIAFPAFRERPAGPTRRRRLAWAELLKRVFAIDVVEYSRCRGPMRILATIHPPEATPAIPTCLGLSVRAPPLAPARRDEEACSEWPDATPDDFES